MAQPVAASEAKTMLLLRRWSEANVKVNKSVDKKRRFNDEFRQAKASEKEARNEKKKAKRARDAASRAIKGANREIRSVLTQIRRFQVLTVASADDARLIGVMVESGDFTGGIMISDGLTHQRMTRLRNYCIRLNLRVLN